MPVPFGRSTKVPFGPPKVWITPTEGFPGSATVAIWKLTTPGLTPEDARSAVTLVVVPGVLDVPEPAGELLPCSPPPRPRARG